MFELIKEIFGRGYDWDYRWFRIRELVGFPSYDPNDGYEEKLNEILGGGSSEKKEKR
jgi:hypothetical protein